MIRIDFETRSELDVTQVGAWRYAAHPSTEILCLAYKFSKEPAQLWKAGTPFPDALTQRIQAGELVESHNAGFERAIWALVIPRQVPKAPPIPLSQWRCSAAKASVCALPRALEQAGLALRLSIQKDAAGNKVMRKLCKPRKPTKNNPAKWHNDAKDFEKLYSYCLQDVDVEEALSDCLPPLSPTELQVWRLNERMNERGIYCDTKTVRAAFRVVAKRTQQLNDEIQQLTNGEIDSANQVAALRAYLNNKLGCFTPDLRKERLAELLEDERIDPKAKRILEIRQARSRSSTKKLNAMLRTAGTDNRIRDCLMYHGASTGRWAGKLIQPQNLPRGTVKDVDGCIEAIKAEDLDWLWVLYGEPMEAVSSCLRGFLTAAPGNELIASDYKSIESRVLFWLAGQWDAVKKYEDEADLYVDMAQAIYSVPQSEITKPKRQVGKHTVLGCGYGMGPDKFIETCWIQGQIKVDHTLAQQAVNTYRGKYYKVPEFWKACERAAILAVKHRGSVSVVPIRSGGARIAYQVKRDFLRCRLPSGRMLYYYKPSLEKYPTPWGDLRLQLSYMGINSLNHKWTPQLTYGGKLVENIVQAVSRDLMADAMLRLEEKSYPVVLTVHDEIVTEKKKGTGSLEELNSIIATRPEWAKTCPISVEGWQGIRYRKG